MSGNSAVRKQRAVKATDSEQDIVRAHTKAERLRRPARAGPRMALRPFARDDFGTARDERQPGCRFQSLFMMWILVGLFLLQLLVLAVVLDFCFDARWVSAERRLKLSKFISRIVAWWTSLSMAATLTALSGRFYPRR